MNDCRVVKVGGSLLDWESLREELSRWLAAQPPTATNVLLAGGGAIAEALREADRAHCLGEEVAHSLAISALGVTSRLLSALLPQARFEESWEACSALVAKAAGGAAAQAPIVLDPAEFLHRVDAAHPAPLPHSWQVTSDSIAARVASSLKGCELVLLKSALPEGSASPSNLAASGYVDRYFPLAAAGLPRVRLVNLREAGWPQRVLPLDAPASTPLS